MLSEFCKILITNTKQMRQFCLPMERILVGEFVNYKLGLSNNIQRNDASQCFVHNVPVIQKLVYIMMTKYWRHGIYNT